MSDIECEICLNVVSISIPSETIQKDNPLENFQGFYIILFMLEINNIDRVRKPVNGERRHTLNNLNQSGTLHTKPKLCATSTNNFWNKQEHCSRSMNKP